MNEFESCFETWEDEANAEAEQPKHWCEACQSPIYEGETYYDMFGDILCEECVKNCKKQA
jgi:hypothetical protein